MAGMGFLPWKELLIRKQPQGAQRLKSQVVEVSFLPSEKVNPTIGEKQSALRLSGDRQLLFAEEPFKVDGHCRLSGQCSIQPLIELRLVDSRVPRSVDLFV